MSAPTKHKIWQAYSFDPILSKASCLLGLTDDGLQCNSTYEFSTSAMVKGQMTKNGNVKHGSSVGSHLDIGYAYLS